MKNSNTIYVGIDAGVNSGFAVWDSASKKFMDIRTIDFWGCIESITALADSEAPYEIEVVIEDPSQNKPVFNRGIEGRQNLRVAQNVGMNKREATLIKEFCEKEGIKYRLVRPTKKKVDADTFKKLTGYEGRTSQHARDSAMLVWGM